MDNIISSDPNGNNPNFPLTVWLTGEEDYFNDFSLSAEDVMKKIGIKRSRLRQISGTELRVGRTKIDRYIKPLYRPSDVDDYLTWTRPTASHKKSSDILNNAASDLASQAQGMIANVEKNSLKLSENITNVLENLQSFIGEQCNDLLSEIYQKLNHIKKLNDLWIEDEIEILKNQLFNLGKISKKSLENIAEISNFKSSMITVASQVQSQEFAITEIQKNIREIMQTFEELKTSSLDYLEQWNEIIQNIEFSCSSSLEKLKEWDDKKQLENLHRQQLLQSSNRKRPNKSHMNSHRFQLRQTDSINNILNKGRLSPKFKATKRRPFPKNGTPSS